MLHNNAINICLYKASRFTIIGDLIVENYKIGYKNFFMQKLSKMTLDIHDQYLDFEVKKIKKIFKSVG